MVGGTLLGGDGGMLGGALLGGDGDAWWRTFVWGILGGVLVRGMLAGASLFWESAW